MWDRQHWVSRREGVEMGYENKGAIGLVQSEDGLRQDKAESSIFACIVQ